MSGRDCASLWLPITRLPRDFREDFGGDQKIGQLSSGSWGGSSGGATAAALGRARERLRGDSRIRHRGLRLGNSSGMGAGVAASRGGGQKHRAYGFAPRTSGPSMAFASRRA